MLRKPKEVIMKERMFSAGFSSKASSLLLGFFLVLTAAFLPTVVGAQFASCSTIMGECFARCTREYPSAQFKEEYEACGMGCALYCNVCKTHLGAFATPEICDSMLNECLAGIPSRYPFAQSDVKPAACAMGCVFYWNSCSTHIGVITGSLHDTLFWAEATLQLFEKMVGWEAKGKIGVSP